MQYSYKIHRDIYQDAWNWWDACNSINFGSDWSKKVDIKIALKIKGKKRQPAYQFLIPYLKNRYQTESSALDKNVKYITKQLESKFEPACNKLIEVMGKPLYRQELHLYLTTFPSIPINKERGFIWLNYYWADPVGTFLHELSHLQFIHYWRENPASPVSKLSNEQFELLKESLTIILDQDFFPLITEEDQGYSIHKDFRKDLKNFWDQDKNFERLVNYSLDKLRYIK